MGSWPLVGHGELRKFLQYVWVQLRC